MIQFSRLVITKRAADNELGRELIEAFSGRSGGVAIRDLLSPDRFDRREAAVPTTLFADAQPAAGWFHRAEHGNLFVRSGEHYLRHAGGCQFDCDYCYLRAGSRLRPIIVYTDFQAMSVEYSRLLEAAPLDGGSFINAGEYADSLVAVPDFTFVLRLIEALPQVGGDLELRTKSGNVDALLGLAHGGCTTVAFSLSPEPIVVRHERRTGTLAARIAAARAAHADGYRIAFKFEPILPSPTWWDDYEVLVTGLCSSVNPQYVNHISVGSLRWGATLGAEPVFSAKMWPYQAEHETVSYRKEMVNYTISGDARMAIYRRILTLLEANGFDCPTYLSLESASFIQQLSREFEAVRLAHVTL